VPDTAPAPDPCGNCELCGQPALVRILVDYAGSERVERRYCLVCADKREVGPEVISPFLPRLLVWSGVVIGVVSVSADFLGISGSGEFGWRQVAGTELGALLMVVGVMVRRAVVSIGGMVLLALSIGAEWFRVGHSPGVGWRQGAALAVSAVLIGSGLLASRRRGPAPTGGAGTPPSGPPARLRGPQSTVVGR
jgi:hypothetical protein